MREFRAGRGRREVATADEPPSARHLSMTWALRLKRVFKIDIATCEPCGGAVKVIASIEDPAVIKRILEHLERRSERATPACRTIWTKPYASPFFLQCWTLVVAELISLNGPVYTGASPTPAHCARTAITSVRMLLGETTAAGAVSRKGPRSIVGIRAGFRVIDGRRF